MTVLLVSCQIGASLMAAVVLGVAGEVLGMGSIGIEDLLPYLLFINVPVFVPFLIWGWWRSGLSVSEAFGLVPVSVGLLVSVAVCHCGLAILTSELDNLCRTFFPLPNYSEYLWECVSRAPIVLVVALVVMAPVTEESLFRGLFLGGFLRRYGRVTAVLGSAFLFAIMHLNPAQLLPTFIIGLVIGIWFVYTRSLWACLLAHAVHNASLPLSFFVLSVEIPGWNTPPEAGVFQPLWFDALGIGLFGFGMAWFFFLIAQARGPAPCARPIEAGLGTGEADWFAGDERDSERRAHEE